MNMSKYDKVPFILVKLGFILLHTTSDDQIFFFFSCSLMVSNIYFIIIYVNVEFNFN